MTVNSYLTSLASDLVLSSDERTSIATSISSLSSKLSSWFSQAVTSQFQFGSSTRGTILPRRADKYSDVDYLVVFDDSDGRKKPQTYLDRLRTFANNKYARSDISQEHPTLVLSLNHIRFELVPAVYDWSGYQIPSPAKSWSEWVYTDPSGANTQLQEKNKANSSQIKPLVRLVKYWNACNDYPFASFSIEQAIISQYFWMSSSLCDYFYAFWDSFQCPYAAPQYIKDKVALAKERVRRARDYESQGSRLNAVAEVKKVVSAL